MLGKKAKIHQVTTMLTTSKNFLFPGNNQLWVLPKFVLMLNLPMLPGFELTFFSGVYGTCVGHTQQFGHTAKSMIGLCGMAIGVGEILGETFTKNHLTL